MQPTTQDFIYWRWRLIFIYFYTFIAAVIKIICNYFLNLKFKLAFKKFNKIYIYFLKIAAIFINMFLTGLIFIFLYYSANLKKKNGLLGSWDVKTFWLNSLDSNIYMLTGNGVFNIV